MENCNYPGETEKIFLVDKDCILTYESSWFNYDLPLLDNLGVYIVTQDGHILGKPDYSRLNNAKWYQKLMTKISKKYKNKFIDVKPFEVI